MKLSYDSQLRKLRDRDTSGRAEPSLSTRVAELEREAADLRSQLMPFRKLGPRP